MTTNQDEAGLLRRTALTAGVLVGASTLWVGLLCLMLVSLADRAFSDKNLAGSDSTSMSTSTPAHASTAPRAHPVSP